MSPRSRSPPDWLRGLKKVVYTGGSPSRQQVPRDDTHEGLRLISASGPSLGVSAAVTPRDHSRIDKASGFEAQQGGVLGQAVAEAKAFFLDTKLNLLLFAFPFAILSRATGWGDGPTLVFSMIALCPLAERLGFVTEQLAMYTNDTLGGLLNASFGNATEVIISGFALKHGYVRIVQLSLLGSVISNLLLVLGTAFIAGGIRNTSQTFNQQGIGMNCALLLLGVVAVLLPSLLSETKSEAHENASELWLSRFESIFLLLVYLVYLVFQLVTHRFLYEEDGDAGKPSKASAGDATPRGGGGGGDAFQGAANGPNGQLQHGGSLSFRDLESGGGGGEGGAAAASGRVSGFGSGAAAESTGAAPGQTVAVQRNMSGRRSLGSAAVELSVRTGGANSRQSSGRPGTAVASAEVTANGLTEALADDGDGGTPASRRAALQRPNGALGGGRGGDDTDDEGRTPAHRKADGKEEEGEGKSDGGDDDEEELVLSKTGCFVWLVLVTLCIALLSEWIVDAIKGASQALNVPMPFLVTILLPIVGNAAEHASAIVFAWKNRMEIALGVAVGSSTQVAVLVVPFCVVLAWMMGQPLDLNFNAFEAAVYFFSILLAIITVQDGTSNYLKGLVLLVAYVLVSAGFFWHKDTNLAEEDVDAA